MEKTKISTNHNKTGNNVAVKLMLAMKLIALVIAFLMAPKLMATTFFCFFGVGTTLGKELPSGNSRFRWITLTFAFMGFIGCLVLWMFSSIPYTTMDMVVISAAWTIVFGIPQDICDTSKLQGHKNDITASVELRDEPAVIDAEIVE